MYHNILNASLSGQYKLQARKNGKSRDLTDWFSNVITNGGLDRKGTDSDFMNVCHVGDGNATPSETDDQLDYYIASVQWNSSMGFSDGVQVSDQPFYGRARRTYVFDAAMVSGELSEVGISWTTNATGPLFSRALILDSLGNPTSVTILSDEELVVLYELRLFPPENDLVTQITDAETGQTHNVTIRPSRVNRTVDQDTAIGGLSGWGGLPVTTSVTTQNSGSQIARVYSGSIGSVTSLPSGNNAAISSRTDGTYVAGTYEKEIELFWDMGDGNIQDGVQSIRCPTGMGEYQLQFDPIIDKLNTQELTIKLILQWSRR